ncbi:MAG TPA: RDD family protein [Trebonia sp.]
MTGQPGMTGQEAAKLAAARRGYGQSDAPPVPPGMYLDPGSGVVLPEGVRLASRGRLGAAFCLAIPLFAVTLGVGYIIWGVVSWGQGRTPAQRLLRLRCWLPEGRRVAGREDMAVRQVLGLAFAGQLLIGVWLVLFTRAHMSLGDFLAGTVVVYDPDGVLPGLPPA